MLVEGMEEFKAVSKYSELHYIIHDTFLVNVLISISIYRLKIIGIKYYQSIIFHPDIIWITFLIKEVRMHEDKYWGISADEAIGRE